MILGIVTITGFPISVMHLNAELKPLSLHKTPRFSRRKTTRSITSLKAYFDLKAPFAKPSLPFMKDLQQLDKDLTN